MRTHNKHFYEKKNPKISLELSEEFPWDSKNEFELATVNESSGSSQSGFTVFLFATYTPHLKPIKRPK